MTGIALECGFGHVQHFSTAFKEATGMTLRECRQLTSNV
ncbi:helix-turn-helix domain-containing protein [Rhizobium lusitanum]|uniref:Helix-turn-helix domain-containing protein n=1 Tax=Rhizobium lusitanum TaxID=293958 RepID=A0A6L9UFQ9_9HYPH|nr:helix-turn-helix domain-containing protein [Rhizobium lusitanum]